MLLKVWNRISGIGVRSEYDEILVKRITLTNQFTFIASLIFLFSGIINYVIGDSNSSIILESLVVVCVIGFYINHLLYHRFAISFLFTVISLALFYFDSYSGFYQVRIYFIFL